MAKRFADSIETMVNRQLLTQITKEVFSLTVFYVTLAQDLWSFLKNTEMASLVSTDADPSIVHSFLRMEDVAG